MITFPFPKDFLFGTGSSAFQVEGSAYTDGKGETIWDYMCRTKPESFYNQAKTDPASWFYTHYEQDIRNMKELGLKSFRFSICWARILPEGTGADNPLGIAFYNRFIDLLLENGMEPFVDLYHWDLPLAIEHRGGIQCREFIDWFLEYAQVCFTHFGDRVRYWSTFNEPGVFCFQHYSGGASGWYPYGEDMVAGYRAAHHVLIAHYRTVKLFRQMEMNGKIGAVIDITATYPQDPAGKDLLAAQYQIERGACWWLDPIFRGHYPEKVLQDCPQLRAWLPDGCQEELLSEFAPVDMIGINYYFPSIVRYDDTRPLKSTDAPSYYVQEGQRFQLYPAGLYDAMLFLTERYDHPEIYITENGLGEQDSGDLEKELQDDSRIHYLREHLRMVVRSIRAGANIKGYYYWSNFDSLESRAGYRWRFGLNYVDFPTGKRYRKKSWYYYQKIIQDCAVD